jgi:hypothetical protein
MGGGLRNSQKRKRIGAKRGYLVEYIDLEKKTVRGKELFSELVRVVSDFLERLDELAPADIHAFESKRRELLEELISFYSDFRREFCANDRELSPEMKKKLEEFRIYQEVFIQIIMTKGAEIVSRATSLKDRLRGEIAILTTGKNALRGYDGKRGSESHSLNKAA